MAEQPGMARQRLHTSWCTAHQPSWSSSFALQRHLLRYDTGIESREQLGQVVHVNAQLRPARLLPYSTDGIAAGHDPPAPPGQLARSASVVMVIQRRAAAASTLVRHGHREPREQLGQVVHVNAQLKPARLLRCSTDGSAAGHGPAAPPDQLTRSASLVLLI